MNDIKHVSSTPHIRDGITTKRIMLFVIIALLPAAAFGIWNFGYRAVLLIAVCVLTCVAAEFLYETGLKKEITIGDLSAVVTGLLLAMNLPVTLPLWMAVLGSLFAIIIAKMLFGGIGQNFMNPALAGRCFLMICFAAQMTNFVYDGVSTATPLMQIRQGNTVSLTDMIIGRIPGTIGETSAIAIVIGAVFLIITGVIDLRIPGTYLISFLLFMILFAGHGLDPEYLIAELCGGGLLLGAFFMATDYATSPITGSGKYIYGLCLGILTGLFRVFSSSAEGVSFAIIICNLLVPLIELITMPKCFGKGGE
ncbi:MAG: RnfABCDGE type electron transport complex subunit D [Lachnospiraceae bacterium]|nr:RnfABCDGE type electron transport complex subunit D [Lachnospiraceae bacterium]